VALSDKVQNAAVLTGSYSLKRCRSCAFVSEAAVTGALGTAEHQNALIQGEEDMEGRILALGGMLVAFFINTGSAQQAQPKGVYSFGTDQTIADIGKMEWAPLKLEGLPPGIEIATLRGDLAKGGGEILLRTPPKYVVPNHSHTSDELYVWLKGSFTYIAADGTRQKLDAPAYISLPGQSAHALECGEEQCIFYLRYGRPFDLHIHDMPLAKQ
jgi:hypothetical protein